MKVVKNSMFKVEMGLLCSVTDLFPVNPGRRCTDVVYRQAESWVV